MHRRRLVQGLTAVFGAVTTALVVLGVLTNPGLLVLAAVFGVVTALLWYQASGRLARRVYRRVEQQATVDGAGARAGRGSFGAGPREEWTGPHRRSGRAPPGAGAGRKQAAGRQQRSRWQQARRRQRAGRQPGSAADADGLTAREAYDVLGLSPGADEEAIRSAYRDRIKEVHPDAEGGDEASFRRVRTAYERLSG